MEQNLGTPEQTQTEDNPESHISEEESDFYLMKNFGAHQQNMLEFYEVVGLMGITIQMKKRNEEEIEKPLQILTTPDLMDLLDNISQKTQEHLIGPTEEISLDIPTTPELIEEFVDTSFQRTQQDVIHSTEEMETPLEKISNLEVRDDCANTIFQRTQEKNLIGLTEEIKTALKLVSTPELKDDCANKEIKKAEEQHLIGPTEEMEIPLSLSTPELKDDCDNREIRSTEEQHSIGPIETYENFIHCIRSLEAENISRIIEYKRILGETEIMEVFSENKRHYNPNEIIEDLQQLRQTYSNFRNQYYRERIQRILQDVGTENVNEQEAAIEEMHKDFTEENIEYLKRAMAIVLKINASPYWMEGYIRTHYAFASMYHQLVYKQLMHCALQRGLSPQTVCTVEGMDNEIHEDLITRLREMAENPDRYDDDTNKEIAENIRMQFILTPELYTEIQQKMTMQNISQNRSDQDVDTDTNTNLPAQQDVNAPISASQRGETPNNLKATLDQCQPTTTIQTSSDLLSETLVIPVSPVGETPNNLKATLDQCQPTTTTQMSADLLSETLVIPVSPVGETPNNLKATLDQCQPTTTTQMSADLSSETLVIPVSPVGETPNNLKATLDQCQPTTTTQMSADLSSETLVIPVSPVGANPLTETQPGKETNITTVIPLGPDSDQYMVLEYTEGARPTYNKIEHNGTRRSITLAEFTARVKFGAMLKIRIAPNYTNNTMEAQITVSSSVSTSMTAGPSSSSMFAGPSSAGSSTSAGPSSSSMFAGPSSAGFSTSAGPTSIAGPSRSAGASLTADPMQANIESSAISSNKTARVAPYSHHRK